MIEIILIIALCVVAFLPTINFHLIVDDIRHASSVQSGMFANQKLSLRSIASRLYGVGTLAKIDQCPRCKGRRRMPEYIEGSIKEMPCVNCKATGRAWVIDTKAEHAFTMLLHTTACVLIYFAFGQNVVSTCAAMLYAVNPTNTQTSVWLNGRRYLVNVIIVLLMISLGPLAAPLYLFTPLLQVNAIFAPVMYGWPGFILVGAVIAYAWPKWIKSKVDQRFKGIINEDMKTWHPGRFVVVVKTFGWYTAKMIFPSRTMLVYPYIVNWGLHKEGNDDAYRLDLFFFIGVVAMLAAVFGFATLEGNEKWWVALAFLSLLQQCNIIPATQTIADRYCSIPIIFVMYFTAKFVGPIGTTLLATYYLTRLFEALHLFRDINSYYDYHLFHDPAGTIVRKFKINWMLKSGDVMGAWELIKAGLIRNPKDFSMLYQAAVCMAQMGDKKSFDHYMDKAEENHYLGQEKLWAPHIQEMRDSYKKNVAPRHVSPVEFAKGRR